MRSPRRGEIYLLKGDKVGKNRPVLVVSPLQLNGGFSVLAVPFYSQQLARRASMSTCVYFASGEFGLNANCVAKTDEVSIYRISELSVSDGPIGTVDDVRMEEVSGAMSVSLGITPFR